MAVERTDEAIHVVVYDRVDPTWRTDYDGTLSGKNFIAATKDDSSVTYCAGGTKVSFHGASQVTGQFSDDGNVLNAEEVQTLFLNTGETLILRFVWTASKQ